MRAGTRALTLLAAELNCTILRALSGEPKQLVDLRRECGSPAHTTLRAHLKSLDEVGALVRRKQVRFPGSVDCELTPAGQELLFLAAVVERWLAGAPEGPLPLGSSAAKSAIKALADGWTSSILRVLAARPLSLTELDGVISTLSYPALERRLTAMRLVGQVEACTEPGRGTTPYGVTDWVRLGIGPLAAAAQWERRNLPHDTAAIGPIDAETAFLLALPLLRLPGELRGACRLGVEMKANGSERRLVGALARVEDGRVASCTVRLNESADAWAVGAANAWLHAVIESDADGLELGGDQRLARALLDGLHGALFGGRQASHDARSPIRNE